MTAIADPPLPRADAIADPVALDVLVSLVHTPSFSGDEAAAAAVFVHRARALGMRARIDAAGNAIAERGDLSPGAREIILLGHIDTVPGHIPVRIEHSDSGWHRSRTCFLWGRGAVDAKGPLAAFLVAASRARLPDGVRIVVAGAVGEETPRSPGARHLAAAHRARPPIACIIGEPSGADGLTLGYKGRLLIHAECIRPCAHTAGPGGSAADALLDWWRAEESALDAQLHQSRELQLAGTPNPPTAPTPQRAFDSLQRTVRALSTSSDGLTDCARATIGLRLPPGVDPQELERAIRSRAPAHITLRFEGHEAAVLADRNNPVALALTSAIRAEGHTPRPKHKTGTSDMNIVSPAWNCPIAAYGPGDSALDHTPDERLDLAEYATAIRVLTRAIETLAAPV